MNEESQFKLSTKSIESNATAFRSLSSKRNIIASILVAIFAILLIPVIFSTKLRNFHASEKYVTDQNISSNILARGSNHTLFPREYSKVKDQPRRRRKHEIFGLKSFGFFKSSMSENTKFWMRIVVSIVIFSVLLHRLLGILFSFCVRQHLGRKRVGSYLVDVEWIGLRLGFERNEIVIHNMMWHNPPLFTATPYFVSIEDILIRWNIILPFKYVVMIY